MPTDTAQRYIAVDFGGSNIRAALFSHDGQFLKRARQPTPKNTTGDIVFQAIVATIRAVYPADPTQLAAIGIGSPGPLDPYRGLIISAPNVSGWENYPLRDNLSAALQCPVYLDNDANLGALGEWQFGAARGYDDVLYYAIGTGVGGGIISGGHLVRGRHGLAGEIGLIMFERRPDRTRHADGGFLEDLTRGPVLAQQARDAIAAGERSLLTDLVAGDLSQLHVGHLGQAAAQGDPLAQRIIDQAGYRLGLALADFMHILNPGIVVMGGGVSNLGERLFAPMRRAVEQFTFSDSYWRDCPIVPAELGDDAGLYGALALARQHHPAPQS